MCSPTPGPFVWRYSVAIYRNGDGLCQVVGADYPLAVDRSAGSFDTFENLTTEEAVDAATNWLYAAVAVQLEMPFDL